ncbi:MAG: MFS transporter [Candidatus Acetothermia bacterium]|jgi:predicted MFS family arabinose efflux permease|nr:MFS transporter [Candidatus Acetothermia bacterium]MDH7505341.1 MFS transporter [Candidatus Acetothermia bacterium]
MRRPLFTLIEAVRLDRDLRLIMLSNFFWSSGFMLYSFLWPIYVRDLGGTAREIGLLSSLMFLTMTVTLIPGGALAERWNRKWLILITWIIATPAPLVYALARSWEHLAPGVVIYSFFLGWPAYEAYIAAASAPGRLSRAYALTSAGFSLGAILAPLIGAALLPSIGIRRIFFLAFALFSASTATLFFLSPQQSPEPPRSGDGRGKLASLLRDRRLMTWLFVFALAALGTSAARPFIPPLLQDRFALARPAILMMSALLSLGEVVLAVLLGWIADRWRRSRALGLALASTSLGFILLFTGLGPYLVPLAMVSLGGDRVSLSLSRSIVGHRARSGASGPAFTLYWVVLGIAQTLGPSLGGTLYAGSALRPFYLGAGLTLLSAGILWKLGELRSD